METSQIWNNLQLFLTEGNFEISRLLLIWCFIYKFCYLPNALANETGHHILAIRISDICLSSYGQKSHSHVAFISFLTFDKLPNKLVDEVIWQNG